MIFEQTKSHMISQPISKTSKTNKKTAVASDKIAR